MKYKIQEINNSPYMLYAITAGGGQSFFSEYMQYGGASRTIIGGNIPYAKEAFDEVLNKKSISKYVSEQASLRLATQAFNKGRSLCVGVPPANILGIGVTCSLATDNERSGRLNHAYIAIHSYNFTISSYIKFHMHDRIMQEAEIASHIINILYDIVHNDHISQIWHTTINTIDGGIAFSNRTHTGVNTNMYDFTIGIQHIKQYYKIWSTINLIDDVVYVYPGSWNPLHDGHLAIIEYTKNTYEQPVFLELTVDNADKGVLDYYDVYSRHDNALNMVITQASTFVEKAQLFSKLNRTTIFMVGADTWLRIQDPIYAGDINILYDVFVQCNVKFLVFGRNNIQIETNTIMDNLLIKDYNAWSFNNNTSSTELREKFKL